MITKLRLANFRRHEDTELVFDATDQMVLISGANGAGKTSIIESLTYALYGEGRHGRRHLDNLIRRGAALEGMEVECDFTVGDTTYSVTRRRDGKSSTAVLYGNGIALVESPSAVTAEVTKIFGMDSAGFRVAVLAQQKELDGLASLQPARRAEMLARLLRLDAITAAKDMARSRFRSERDILRALGVGDDIDALAAEVERSEVDLLEARGALEEGRETVVALEAQLAASAGIDAAYHQARNDIARAEGAMSVAQGEVERLTGELAALRIPDALVTPERDLDALYRDAHDTERAIAQGEAALQVAGQRAMVAGELARVEARAGVVDTRLGDLDDAVLGEARLASLVATIAEGGATLVALTDARQDLRDAYGEAGARLSVAEGRRDTTAELGAVCVTCAQEITDAHRAGQAELIGRLIGKAEADLGRLRDQGGTLSAEIAALALRHDADADAAAVIRSQIVEATALQVERADLARRADTYGDQLGRLSADVVDLDELYARKGGIAIAVAAAQRATEATRVREAVLSRKAGIDDALAGARSRGDQAKAAVDAAALDADLAASYARRQELLVERDAEVDLAGTCATEVALATERLRAARETVRVAHDRAQGRHTREERARVAANAAKLLADVEETMATQIRPALEGTIATHISALSDGRFSSVTLDADYNLTVVDDGAPRALGEFSGGEIDLIALAVRLALASVVAERHGSGGTGFLILDECFGSQDPQRRQSILTALRSLRSTYGQLFLVSHIGGLEDAADSVVEITSSPDRTSIEVSVT